MTQQNAQKVLQIAKNDGITLKQNYQNQFVSIIDLYLCNGFKVLSARNKQNQAQGVLTPEDRMDNFRYYAKINLSEAIKTIKEKSEYFQKANFSQVYLADYAFVVAAAFYAGKDSIMEFINAPAKEIPPSILAIWFLLKQFIGQEVSKKLPIKELQDTVPYIERIYEFYEKILTDPELSIDDFETVILQQQKLKQRQSMAYVKIIPKMMNFSKEVHQECYSLELYKITAMYLFLIKHGKEKEQDLVRLTKEYMDKELPPIYDKHYIYMLVFVYCYNFLQMQNTLKKNEDLLFLMVSVILGKDASIREQRKREREWVNEDHKIKEKYTKSTNFIDYLKEKPEIVRGTKKYFTRYSKLKKLNKYYLYAFADYLILWNETGDKSLADAYIGE